MMDDYTKSAFNCSKQITRQYSTSFSLGIRMLHRTFHKPVYGIYAFVRYADEIVDTFHDSDQVDLLEKFKADTFDAIDKGISLNPVLHAFQKVVSRYQIPAELIEAFLHSMEMDLTDQSHSKDTYNTYIYGSAEVVGLMCLKVFCDNDEDLYKSLQAPARSLGAAFQKVNFLRDFNSDYEDRGRVYFPGMTFQSFDHQAKQQIEEDIRKDFNDALDGIRRLPAGARPGVYLAYVYYRQLFTKICRTSPSQILEKRIRVPNILKLLLLGRSVVQHRLNVI